MTVKQIKKNRVLGNNGPDRKELQPYGIVDNNVPSDVIDSILYIANNYLTDDLMSDDYKIITKHLNVNLNDIINQETCSNNYSQIILQQFPLELIQNKDTETHTNEKNHTIWRNDLTGISTIKNYLISKFINPYRARISVMSPGHELNYHIDTNTSVLCRIQIPIQVTDSYFQWKVRKEEMTLQMKEGNAYFINTGWPHRVINSKEFTRISLIFGIDWDNIPNKDSLRILSD